MDQRTKRKDIPMRFSRYTNKKRDLGVANHTALTSSRNSRGSGFFKGLFSLMEVGGKDISEK